MSRLMMGEYQLVRFVFTLARLHPFIFNGQLSFITVPYAVHELSLCDSIFRHVHQQFGHQGRGRSTIVMAESR